MEYHAEHGLGSSFGPLFCFLFWDLVLKKKKKGGVSFVTAYTAIFRDHPPDPSEIGSGPLAAPVPFFEGSAGGLCCQLDCCYRALHSAPDLLAVFFFFPALGLWLFGHCRPDPPRSPFELLLYHYCGVFWFGVLGIGVLLYILILDSCPDFLTLPVLSLPFFPFSLLLPSIRSPLLFLFRVIVDPATAERGTRVTLSSTPRSTGCRQNAGVPECHRTHSIL